MYIHGITTGLEEMLGGKPGSSAMQVTQQRLAAAVRTAPNSSLKAKSQASHPGSKCRNNGPAPMPQHLPGAPYRSICWCGHAHVDVVGVDAEQRVRQPAALRQPAERAVNHRHCQRRDDRVGALKSKTKSQVTHCFRYGGLEVPVEAGSIERRVHSNTNVTGRGRKSEHCLSCGSLRQAAASRREIMRHNA